MRIAQLVESLEAGGAERLAVGIAADLAERGHESHLIVLRSGGAFASLVSPRVRLHSLGVFRGEGAVGPGALGALVVGMNRLRGLTSRNRIEVLQTHLPLANYLGLGLSYRGDPAFLPTIHNSREFAYGQPSSWRVRLRRMAYRDMLVRCRRMIAVTEAVKAAMLKELDAAPALADRIAVVPNAVVVPPRPDNLQKLDLRREFGLPLDGTVIVGAGRLTEQKGFADLVAALGWLSPDTGPWVCLVAGEGPLRESLQALIRDQGMETRILLPGHVERLDRLFAAADIFCLPSRWEGLPLVLLEAMAAGLPVLASAIDGVHDAVADGKEALLHTAGDIDGLARNLQILVKDPVRRSTLGSAGLQTVRERYDFGRLVDTLVSLYQSSIHRQDNRP